MFKRFFSSSLIKNQLALSPEKWIGLGPEEIIKLSKQRRAILGGKFKHSDDELKALLTTSNFTGVSPSEIRVLYEKGELGAHELSGLKFEDDHTPLPFEYDEYPEAAQEIIRDHREQREYNRIAAYEMPHLAKYRQEYKPSQNPITYKYTTYLGEPDYSANRKVKLITKVKDLNLNKEQQHKFKVIAGSRYNFQTDVFKMSTDRFNEPLQNTRFLSDTLNNLINEAKDLSKETFSDIPLDKRHVLKTLSKPKAKHQRYRSLKFPEDWKRPQDAPKSEKTVLDYVNELKL